jgi:hypothetical protein
MKNRKGVQGKIEGVTLSSAIAGTSSSSLPESVVSDDGVEIEVSCDMLWRN